MPTEERLAKMRGIAASRTRHYTFVLEDFNDPHNISAVMRTCECFGIQDVHVIEEVRKFRASYSILRGAGKWLTLHRWSTRGECLDYLRKEGYRIAVASSKGEKSFHQSDMTPKTAIYMGTEFFGPSGHILENSDLVFRIPQHGFTESLNVSVCAGMLVFHLDRHIEIHGRENFAISSAEQEKLVSIWVDSHGTGKLFPGDSEPEPEGA
jgi:tRNA (guanosine-2'-O-)-methyltransferase